MPSGLEGEACQKGRLRLEVPFPVPLLAVIYSRGPAVTGSLSTPPATKNLPKTNSTTTNPAAPAAPTNGPLATPSSSETLATWHGTATA